MIEQIATTIPTMAPMGKAFLGKLRTSEKSLSHVHKTYLCVGVDGADEVAVILLPLDVDEVWEMLEVWVEDPGVRLLSGGEAEPADIDNAMLEAAEASKVVGCVLFSTVVQVPQRTYCRSCRCHRHGPRRKKHFPRWNTSMRNNALYCFSEIDQVM
jgi:hypothetical protein